MSRRRPTLNLGYKRLPAPSGSNDDALAELLDDPTKPEPDMKRTARIEERAPLIEDDENK